MNKQVYLLNAFSLGMLNGDAFIKIQEIPIEKVREWQHCLVSAIGHESTAQVLSQLLGFPVQAQRRQIKLEKGDLAVVFQFLQRLPEGKVLTEEELKALPYKFYLVEVLG